MDTRCSVAHSSLNPAEKCTGDLTVLFPLLAGTEKIQMTFMGKLSASHELLPDSSLCRDSLESGASLLHYVTPEYLSSSTNVSEE